VDGVSAGNADPDRADECLNPLPHHIWY
jgi:hypothetical protein